jgi:predicted nuclease of restriction endonuclease-like RecB superfamily
MNLNELTQEEADLLNQQTEAELQRDVAEYERNREEKVSKGLSHLLGVVESEFIEIEFTGATSKAVLKIRANPSQKTFLDLTRISQKAEKGQETTEEEEDRLCEILEYLCIEPVIPAEVWKSGDVPEEIAARIIIELGKHKVQKREEMENDIKSFRKDRRRNEVARNSGSSGKGTQ